MFFFFRLAQYKCWFRSSCFHPTFRRCSHRTFALEVWCPLTLVFGHGLSRCLMLILPGVALFCGETICRCFHSCMLLCYSMPFKSGTCLTQLFFFFLFLLSLELCPGSAVQSKSHLSFSLAYCLLLPRWTQNITNQAQAFVLCANH